MDSLTHAVLGVGLAALVPADPPTRAALIAGQMLPDIDYVVRLTRGRWAYLKYHRGPTHSVPGQVALALATAGVIKLVSPAASYWPLVGWTLLAEAIHVGLDLLNAYGTQVGWPWDRERKANDILQIIELPFLLFFLLAGIGTYLCPQRRVTFFAGAWILLGLYTLYRTWVHARLVRQVQARFRMLQPSRVSVVPELWYWHTWRYVVQVAGTIYSGRVHLGGTFSHQNQTARRDDQVTRASLQAPTAQVMLEFSRHPNVQYEQRDRRYYVTWTDERYPPLRGRSPFMARVVLDQDLKVIEDGLLEARGT